MTDITPFKLDLLHQITDARQRLSQTETELTEAKNTLQRTPEWNDFILCRDTQKQTKKLLDHAVSLTSQLVQLPLDLPDQTDLLDQVADLINQGALDSADVHCTAVSEPTQ